MELLGDSRQITIRKFSASGDRANKGPRRASLVKSAVFFCPHFIHLCRRVKSELESWTFHAMNLPGLGILGRKAVSGFSRSRLFRDQARR
ncbi:MAG: hypothetical protein EAZ71_12000 [Verrucomicrobia bacterium]|nr:MAG: hypothetical protein EAZ82_11025 [Verrucomicrobiota bacterium]TAF23982.1 MAG: hypothetical protein EAZ71_12000 [Verrucomicrobiota bacterium]